MNCDKINPHIGITADILHSLNLVKVIHNFQLSPNMASTASSVPLRPRYRSAYFLLSAHVPGIPKAANPGLFFGQHKKAVLYRTAPLTISLSLYLHLFCPRAMCNLSLLIFSSRPYCPPERHGVIRPPHCRPYRHH